MKKIIRFIPIIAFSLAIILYIVILATCNETTVVKYNLSYFQVKDGWWIFLSFVPFNIVSCILGIKKKDRIAIVISLVLLSVLLIASFCFFIETKKYSSDKEILQELEKDTSLDFTDDFNFIVYDNKNEEKTINGKKIKYINEGAVWFDEYDYSNQVANDNRWKNYIDEEWQDYLSRSFYISVKNFNKFFCVTSDENEIIFIAYNEQKNIIYFSKFTANA